MMEAVNIPRNVLVDDKTYSVISVRNGGMGRVWLLEQAFDEPFDPIYRRRIAVKTFEFMQDEQAIERELNIWISLEHPLILPLKKIGRLNYRLAAIMSLLEGSLDDLVEARGSLSEVEVAKIISGISEGLEYAWSSYRLLHLDLKPSNVLIEDPLASRIKIADWGISRLAVPRLAKAESRLVNMRNNLNNQRTDYSAGTPLFMAPERFSGNWQLLPAVDIYSLGLIAIQLSTGILPFRLGQTNPVQEILDGSLVENARTILSDRSDAFRNFCLRCINPSLIHRFNDYRDLQAQLKTIIRKG